MGGSVSSEQPPDSSLHILTIPEEDAQKILWESEVNKLEDAHAYLSTNICVSTNSLILHIEGGEEKGGNRNGNQGPCTLGAKGLRGGPWWGPSCHPA